MVEGVKNFHHLGGDDPCFTAIEQDGLYYSFVEHSKDSGGGPISKKWSGDEGPFLSCLKEVLRECRPVTVVGRHDSAKILKLLDSFQWDACGVNDDFLGTSHGGCNSSPALQFSAFHADMGVGVSAVHSEVGDMEATVGAFG